MDPSGTYRVAGDSLRGSRSFQLPRPQGEVVVDAHVNSRGKRLLGMGLTLLGAAVGVFGIITTDSETLPGDKAKTPDARVLGISAIVGGVALMAVGIPVWVTSGSSVEVR